MIQRAAPAYIRKLFGSSSPHLQVECRYYTAQVATSLRPCVYSDDEECPVIDWDKLGFGFMPTDYMYITKSCDVTGNFEQGQLNRYENIQLSPSAGVLNYGQVLIIYRTVRTQKEVSQINTEKFHSFKMKQGLFEGTKAYRQDNGGLSLFRPRENAIRMQIGAERMCMPYPSTDQFVDAVKQTALANKRWIPPSGKGSLYIRPLLFGSGSILGLAPAPEYTFLVYACPVGNYFKEGTAPLNLYIDEDFHRASRGGAGGVKSITNYAPVLRAIRNARERGFSDVLYLDSVNKRYIEEVSSCNIFLVKGKMISTPIACGTILEGVTRKSIMDIAIDLGYQVEERLIEADELISADEVFCTGTAVSVAPVGSITYKGQRIEYKIRSELVCKKLYSTLVGIQKGHIEDKRDWIVDID